MPSLPQIRVLILSDGRPGHFNISEGIAAALGRRFDCHVERIEVRRGRWSGLVLATLINCGVKPDVILRRFYHCDPGSFPVADLIVSAGAETLAASAALARLKGIPNIFYGSLRLFSPAWFSLVLTSYAGQVKFPNQVMALKPSRIDVDTLPVVELNPVQPRIALLIGGDGGGASYSSDDWNSLLGFLEAGHRQSGIRWVVTNSRRTPEDISDRLGVLATGAAACIERFVDVRDARSGSLADVFGCAEAIAVTSDSSTMISEAVQLRRPVIGLAPGRFALTKDEAGYRAYLERQGWITNLPLVALTPDRFLDSLESVVPMSDNALDRLAALILERLPALASRGL